MILFFVAFVAMIVSIGGLGLTTYHTRLAQEEYYNPDRHGARPGQYIGKAAELLNLAGTVTQDAFKALLRGFHPETGEPLLKTAGRDVKYCAYDLVLSANKSFSVAWAMAPDQATRDRLILTFQKTVDQLVKRIEEATYVRVGDDSTPVPAKPLIACFYHLSGRLGDVQIHCHLVCSRIGVTEDGRTGAILSRPYYVRSAAWSELATCDHYVALQKAFPGIRLRATPTGPEIDGFPDNVLRNFSKRRQGMERDAGDLSTLSGAVRALIALKTRPAKQSVPSESELISRTQAEAAKLGFYPQDVANILRPRASQPVQTDRVLAEALRNGLARVTERHSHFSQLDLLRHTARAAAGRGVSGHDVEQYVDVEIQQSPHIEALGEYRGRQRFSTPEVLAQEEDVLTLGAELTKGQSHRIHFAGLVARLSLENIRAVADWMSLDRPTKSGQDQRLVIKSIAQDSGQLAIVSAPAGTARIETITRLGRMYQASDSSVLAIGTTGGRVRRLAEETGLPAMPFRTFQNFVERDSSIVAGAKHAAKQLVREAVGRYIGLFPYQRQPLLDDRTVVLVDGAHQISTQDMYILLKNVQRSGCKLVLVGSPDGDLQAIERGVPFAGLLKRFKSPELTDIVHAEHPQDGKNIRRTRTGQTKEVLTDLAVRGKLHISSSQNASETNLISKWQESGGTANPQSHLIFAADKPSAARLNQLASEARRQERRKSRSYTDESIVLASGEKVYVGDRVICPKTARRYGILAGDMGTVLGVSRRLNSVQLEQDNGDRLTLPLTVYPDLSRGYAVTVWQARPTKQAYLLLSGASSEDRQSALTKLSQATESTHVFVDEQTAGPELKDLIRQFANDRKKLLAKDVQELSNARKRGADHP